MIAPLIVAVVALAINTLMSLVRMIHRLVVWDHAYGKGETELGYAAGMSALMCALSITALIGAGMALEVAYH